MLDRDTSDFIDDDLRAAVAEGRVIVEFHDNSDKDKNDIKMSVKPAPESAFPPPAPNPDVEFALAKERLAIAQERFVKLEEINRSPRVRVIERHFIHRRCWGSWILAALVACELYTQHHDMIAGWFRAALSAINSLD